MTDGLRKAGAVVLAAGVLSFTVFEAGASGCEGGSSARLPAETAHAEDLPSSTAPATGAKVANEEPDASAKARAGDDTRAAASAPAGAPRPERTGAAAWDDPSFLPATKAGPMFRPPSKPMPQAQEPASARTSTAESAP